MILRVDQTSPVPPYEQIRSQISTMVATGVLPRDTRLPAIRQLASDLGLAGGTVARAYKELEQAGTIATSGRRGTFVLGSGTDAAEGAERLRRAAETFAIDASQLGVARADALSAVERALDGLGVS